MKTEKILPQLITILVSIIMLCWMFSGREIILSQWEIIVGLLVSTSLLNVLIGKNAWWVLLASICFGVTTFVVLSLLKVFTDSSVLILTVIPLTIFVYALTIGWSNISILNAIAFAAGASIASTVYDGVSGYGMGTIYLIATYALLHIFILKDAGVIIKAVLRRLKRSS